MMLLCFAGINAQDYAMTAPVGYGAGTTGGGSATPTTVTTMAALKTALTASGNGVILVSGNVQCDYLSVLVTNKTIIGLPGSTLFTNDQTAGGSGILYIKPGSTNVIFRNLTFVGPGAYDSDGRDCLCFDGCTKMWVDHCTFQDGMDGNFDNKALTDNITVSWCKFEYKKAPKAGGSGGTDDHRFTNLVGSDASDKPTDGKYSITWMNCWWAEGCVERMTRARNAELHFLNCYWNSSVAKVNLGLENCNAYVENSTFTKASSIIYKSYGGTINVKFAGCTGSVPANVGTISAPTYAYTALAGTSTVSALTNATCGAGATLLVNPTTGAISTPCSAVPSLVLTSGSAAQSVMATTAIGSIVYTYGGTATTAVTTGLPAGVTATINTTAKTVTIAGSPTTAGTYTYTIATTPAGVALTGTITVAAAVPATLALTSGPATQTAYVGNPISSIIYTYGGGATGVTVETLPTGVTSLVNSVDKTVTISGTPTVAGTKTFAINTVGGSSAAAALSNTITVNTATTLAVPSAITATPSATSATINWTPVANATGYSLYVCDVPSGTGDKVLFHETFNSSTVGNIVYDNASKIALVKNTVSCTEAGTIRIANAIIKFTGLNLTGLDGAKIMIKYKTTALGSAALKVNDESGSSTNYIYKFTANTALFTFDDVIQQTGLAVTGTDYIAIRADSGSDLIIDEIKIYIPSGGAATPICTEYPISGATTSSYTVSGLSTGTQYNYQLKATSTNVAYTNGAYSTAASFTASGAVTPINASVSLVSGSNNQTVVTDNSIATINYNFSGSAVSVTWTGTTDASTPPSGISISKTSSTLSIAGSPATVGTYGYTVTASGIDGGLNASATGTIKANAPTPLAAVGTVTESHTATSVSLNWPAVANATGYVVNWCTTGGGTSVSKNWDFAIGKWALTAANADANLIADATTGRFNYSPATTNAELVNGTGTVISETAGLKFTQTGVSGTTTLSYKLRLGYGTGMIYLNGTGIAISIPCSAGDIVTVVGPAGNATAINRGYTATGGTLNTTSSLNVDATGIMNVAGATGTWVYTATGNAVVITSAGGGMNITSISVSSASAGPTCTEIPVTGTSYTATGLTDASTYTYQVKAITANTVYQDGAYTTASSVTTGNITTSVESTTSGAEFTLTQTAEEISVSGVEVATLDIYSIGGDKVANTKAAQIDIKGLQKGLYIVLVKTTDGSMNSKKFIKK